jgi:hypothetical protein
VLNTPHAIRHPSPRAKRAGFALLLTITLLAFLVVLLVGLASYMRVETAVAGNTQRQAQARQNALTALAVALGQLQTYAGPDQRVTATADAFGGKAGTKHYTGVWDTTQTASPTPLTWLVSGNELLGGAAPLVRLPTSSLTTTGTNPSAAELVGKNSSGTANDVIAPLVPITAVGVPGNSTVPGPTIGRYAWWVGDQGVKAPAALGDPTATASNFNYDPFTSPELLSRIRQQISLGAAASDTSGNPVFEPRDANNAPLVANDKVTVFNQIPFLKNASGTALGLTVPKTYFHTWSPNNFAVLANTKLGGLRQDLSLFSPSNPSPLGAAYDAWANYQSYMEDPTNPVTPMPLLTSPSPADSLRRRYQMQPASSSYPISPVLSFFGLSFSLHNDTQDNSPTKLVASIRCVVELWNPYSSALVPQDLTIVVKGLPVVTVSSTSGATTLVNLQSVFQTSAGTVNFALPFTADGQNPDRSSWLPGRVYDWSALSSDGDPGASGYTTQFYLRNAVPSGSGVQRDAGPPIGPNTISAVQQVRTVMVGNAQTLTIELRRALTNDLLASFTSPTFNAFTTAGSTRAPGAASSDFAYVFRLPDTNEMPTGETALWLQAPGRDVRESAFPASGHTGFVVTKGQAPDPSLLVTSGQSGFPASFPDLLLDRYTDATSENYNEDVPVFELPRLPLLSLGSLQHFFISGARPFTIGNSWASGVQLNGINAEQLFDQFFFSGLSNSVTPAPASSSALFLPNPRLKVLRNAATGVAATVADLQGAPNAASGKFLLQGGAFNLNSVNKAAWTAVLRGARFQTGADFSYLDADPATGTAADATATLSDPALSSSRVATFARFGQSAQETFKADATYTQSQPSAGGTSIIDTPLFRRGVRVLSSTQVAALAGQIVTLMQQRQTQSGPFLSLADFITADSGGLFTDSNGNSVSLLENAIDAAGLNAASNFDTPGVEFSSQWLTQADILTALAPVLFPRSDTFVIRAYGDAINPTTSTTTAPVIEGRAWCEAIVQRVPDYFDFNAAAGTGDAAEVPTAQLTSTLNQTLGRRFKIISFRWLTRSDI